MSGALQIRLLLDRISIEMFVNQGEQTLTYAFLPKDDAAPVAIYGTGGTAKIRQLTVTELTSIWKKQGT